MIYVSAVLGFVGTIFGLAAFPGDLFLHHGERRYWGLLVVASSLWLGASLLVGAWGWAALNGVELVLSLLMWWRKRRKDRARALVGAKSRALRAALVAKMREAAKPRPVLRPQRTPA